MSLYRVGYRKLLKSALVAFRGDLPMIAKAKVELRKHFYANKDVHDSQHLAQLARDIDDLEEILRFRIVQGHKNDKGNFEVKMTPEHIVTVESEQDNPHGPELSPIDTSFLGQSVTVTKTKGSRPKSENSDSHNCNSQHDHDHNHNHKH